MDLFSRRETAPVVTTVGLLSVALAHATGRITAKTVNVTELKTGERIIIPCAKCEC